MSALTEVAFNWIGSGSGQPRFSLPFASRPPQLWAFGDADGDHLRDSLRVEPVTGTQLLAPLNGMLWHVPALTADAAVFRRWPNLKRLDGTPFRKGETVELLAEDDVLLEVWPSAFRRLEYVISSLDVPADAESWELPQMPVPRWLWIRGVGGMVTRANEIAHAQFTGTSIDPDLTHFFAGDVPLLVDAGDHLNTFDGGEPCEIRAFDSLGLPVDPDWFFATLKVLAEDSDFTSLSRGPSGTWNAPARHVLVFCDGAGKPYVSRPDPDAQVTAADPPAEAPLRQVSFFGTSIDPLTIPDSGVLIVADGQPAYAPLVDQLIPIELYGPLQRVSLWPHGTLEKRTLASFSAHTFLRILVADLAQWFPVSANPRNLTAGDDAINRYSDGNEVIPLIDGRHAFREIYRAIRATHTVEAYLSDDHIPAFDPAAPKTAPPDALKERARILLSNAWIHPDASLLGRRAMLAAPRTQADEPPSFDELRSSFFVIGALPAPGLDDFAVAGGRRLWWLLSTRPLPPGSYLDVRQLAVVEDFVGDDPRLPGTELDADIYGVIAPLGGSEPTGWGFAGAGGLCVVPVLYQAGETPSALLRVVTWEPDPDVPSPDTASSGKGRKKVHASGEVTLPPAPAASLDPPVFSQSNVDATQGMHLEFDGVPGRVIVVLEAGTLLDRRPVVVINARTGELIAGEIDANPSAQIRIPVEPFALRDRILVGFPPLAPAPELSGVFFTLTVSEQQVLAAGALGHPTEILGALQEAMAQGIETRLLGWHAVEALPVERIFGTTGMVATIDAAPTGQAILDQLTRRELGVHHQKGAIIRTAANATAEGGGVTAFLGGIDLMATRWDGAPHSAIDPDRQSAPWHDIHCRIRGRAAWDVYRNYRQRWNACLEHPELVGSGDWTALPSTGEINPGENVEDDAFTTFHDGDHAVQINRTLAPEITAYASFLEPDLGDLSILKSYKRVIDEARRFLYIEEQYFWAREIAQRIHTALWEKRLDFVIMLLPKRLNELPVADLMLYAQRRRNLSILLYGVPSLEEVSDPATVQDVSDRVIVFTLKNDYAEPVYVHSKVMVADDLWMTISSSNMSRRSMTYDSEIGAAVIDRRTRRGGQKTARDFRVELMAEHLRLRPEERSLVDDPYDAFRLFREALDGSWPGRDLGIEKSGIAEMDPLHTHYGTQPSEVDGTFLDGVDAIADPDGRHLELPIGVVDVRSLMAALGAAAPGNVYGGLGTLRFSFNVARFSPTPASDIEVSFTLLQFDATVPPDAQDESALIALGPFPADGTAQVGIVRIGVPYRVRATAALRASPTVPLAPFTEVFVTPATFSETPTLTL